MKTNFPEASVVVDLPAFGPSTMDTVASGTGIRVKPVMTMVMTIPLSENVAGLGTVALGAAGDGDIVVPLPPQAIAATTNADPHNRFSIAGGLASALREHHGVVGGVAPVGVDDLIEPLGTVVGLAECGFQLAIAELSFDRNRDGSLGYGCRLTRSRAGTNHEIPESRELLDEAEIAVVRDSYELLRDAK